MNRFKCGESYPAASGRVGGVCSRLVGHAIPSLYMYIGGELKRLVATSSPSEGYSYDGHTDMEMNIVIYRSDLSRCTVYW